MKKSVIILMTVLAFSSCNNSRVTHLETVNQELKITVDSLSIELAQLKEELASQQKIAERQTEIAMQETLRARIAEDSAAAFRRRLKEAKK